LPLSTCKYMLAGIIAGAIAGAAKKCEVALWNTPNRSKRCSKKAPTATEDQAHSGRCEDRLSGFQSTVAPPQHFLYFFPDPQGHGSFRPTLVAFRSESENPEITAPVLAANILQ